MLFDLPALIVLVVLCGLAFDFINGFHDTANAIATVVSTRVLSPRVAIIMASILNFVGAYSTTGVAQTIASGLVRTSTDPSQQGLVQIMVLSAVVGAIAWNLITWYYGIPSSSSHALMGGLCGAALAHGGWNMIIWNEVNADGKRVGLLLKVLVPLVLSPVGGFVIGMAFMTLIYNLFARVHPGRVSGLFRGLQISSAALLSFSHGSNDAQKSMGIITMALLSQGLIHLPAGKASPSIPNWVIFCCAVAMALGTSVGGWRIMKTMGHKIMRLEPVHGFAAQTTASAVILAADFFHAPISTTQVISGSIFGVGATKRLSAVRWTVAGNMVIAWLLTIPASAAVAAATYFFLRATGI